MARRPTLVILTALAVLAAACSGAGKSKATAVPPAQTTTATTTTLPPATTTTTTAPAPSPPVSPLTGLPGADPARLGRPALVVKIDNLDPVARPQSGLTTADICIEEQVEGGITRFACVWQSADTGLVGPIRSTRTTDVAIVSALNHPLYAFSGGQPAFLTAIRAAPIVDVGVDIRPAAYYRYGSKPAPHNLYSQITTLYSFAAAGAGPPPAQFVYRESGQPAVGAAALHADTRFPGSGGPTVTWDWDQIAQIWKRGQNGSADVTTDGGQIRAANVIFEFVNYPIVGYQTVGGVTGPVPMAQLVGQGQAMILTGATQTAATWSKAAPTAVTQFTDASGAPVKLTPGQTWVELVPVGTPVNAR